MNEMKNIVENVEAVAMTSLHSRLNANIYKILI
jgi:hypothetical protein